MDRDVRLSITHATIKKEKGIELSETAKRYNLIVRGIHGIAERANSLLKTTF